VARRGLDNPAADECPASDSQLVLISFPIVPLELQSVVLFNPRICLNPIQRATALVFVRSSHVRTYQENPDIVPRINFIGSWMRGGIFVKTYES
jgi:hypothetical protein